MPRNVEIKAKIGSGERAHELHRLLTQLCAKPGELMRQEDTFFNAKQGRLKLRQLTHLTHPREKCAELIHYERNDEEGPKLSDYVKASVSSGESAKLKEALTRALGVQGNVRKTRILYIYQGQTRVHLDEVENLGDFIEFEVCLRDGQTEEEGTAIAAQLMARLGIPESDLVKGAYLDLLIARKT